MTPAGTSVPPVRGPSAGQVNDLLPIGDWIRHHSLRSWPVLLFLALICVPSIALLILGPNPSQGTFDHAVNGVAEFYQTVKAALPAIQQLILAGHSAPDSLFAVLIEPVRYFILDFVWRFVTDPITHACWSGLTGYFIGLAASGRHRWYAVGWIGLAAAAILHGLNDWGRVNGHWLWIVVVLVSGVLFLGYAKVGSRGDRPAPSVWPPPLAGHPPARHAAAGHPPAARPWWVH